MAWSLRFGRLDDAFNDVANTETAPVEGGFTAMALLELEHLVSSSLTSVWLCTKYELRAAR
jgi:hypothetical protein